MQCPLQLFPYRTQSVVVVEERQEFSGGRGKSLESPIDYGGRSRRSIAEEGEGARMSRRRRRTKEAEEREQHYQVLSDALAFS